MSSSRSRIAYVAVLSVLVFAAVEPGTLVDVWLERALLPSRFLAELARPHPLGEGGLLVTLAGAVAEEIHAGKLAPGSRRAPRRGGDHCAARGAERITIGISREVFFW